MSTMLTAVMVNYNHSRFIPDSLGSLLAQLRPADELIVIDDASTDDSATLMAKMLDGRPNARLLRNEKNIGCVGTMNRGLSLAQGHYVFLAASDDVFYPELFQRGLEMLSAHPQAGLFSSRSDLIDENGANKRLFATPAPVTANGYIAPEQAAVELQRNDSWFMGNTSIYRRDCLLAEGGFNAELKSFSDGFMARVLALKYGACFTPEALGAWRRQQGGMAWSQAVNADHSRMFALVEQEVAKRPGLFPTGYLARWQKRHLFGARHFAAQQAVAARGGAASRFVAGLVASATSLWHFVRMRPWDIWATVTRLLARGRSRR